MSATEQISSVTPEQRKIMESEAFMDFMACEVEGLTRAQRAEQTGKTPSTVSAGIKRIEGHIEKGTIPDPREGSALAGLPGGSFTRKLDRKDVAEGMMEGASVFISELDKLDDEEDRVTKRMQQFTDQIEALVIRRDKLRTLAERAGFDWTAFDAAVADAETGGTEPTTTAPTADAEATS